MVLHQLFMILSSNQALKTDSDYFIHGKTSRLPNPLQLFPLFNKSQHGRYLEQNSLAVINRCVSFISFFSSRAVYVIIMFFYMNRLLLWRARPPHSPKLNLPFAFNSLHNFMLARRKGKEVTVRWTEAPSGLVALSLLYWILCCLYEGQAKTGPTGACLKWDEH